MASGTSRTGEYRGTRSARFGRYSLEVGLRSRAEHGARGEQRPLSRRMLAVPRSAVDIVGTTPPTGKRAELSMAIVNWFRNGKVQRERAYFDLAGLMQQLGIAPTKS